MSDAPILEEYDDGVLLVTLNRAHKRNAFDEAQWDGLRDVLNRARADDSVARDHDRDSVGKDPLDLTVGARNQIVHQLRRHLARTHLGGVKSHRLDHHRLTVGDRLLDRRLRHSARIAQRGVDLTQLLESREIFGR